MVSVGAILNFEIIRLVLITDNILVYVYFAV